MRVSNTFNRGSTAICHQLWGKNKLNVDISNTHWESIFQSTKEIGLRALQWKHLHAINHTNIPLNKMEIENSDKCNACHSDDKDYMTHVLFAYAKVKPTWKLLRD